MSEAVRLGERVFDEKTRYAGIAIARVVYLDHPAQILISSQRDGGLYGSSWFAETRVRPVSTLPEISDD